MHVFEKMSDQHQETRKRQRVCSESEQESDMLVDEYTSAITYPSSSNSTNSTILTTGSPAQSSSSSWLSSPSSSIFESVMSHPQDKTSTRNVSSSLATSHSVWTSSSSYQHSPSSSDTSFMSTSSSSLLTSSQQAASLQSTHSRRQHQSQRPVCRHKGNVTASSINSSSHSSPLSSQRHTPPMGKRRVYTCLSESGTIQTECHFEGTTCMYDTSLPKSRESLVNLNGVFARYMCCLLEQKMQPPVKCILESIHFMDVEQESLHIPQMFEVVQSLMRLQRCTSNLVHHKIGRFINSQSEKKHIPKNSIVCNLGNEAGIQKEKLYTSLLLRCLQGGCQQCRDAHTFDSLRCSSAVAITPCIITQACCRLMELDYQNFTPTFFRQCADVASLPSYSPLVRSSEAPSCVRTALAPLASKKLRKHSLSSLISGLEPVFSLSLAKSAVEAVQYADGDGGYIVVEHFDLLEKYISTLPSQPPMLFLRQHNYHMLQFRELYHDAIELGHEYEIVYGTQQTHQKHKWGYEALVCARGNIARSTKLWLVPSLLDASGNRLLIELFTLEDRELIPRSNGVRLIEAGLSHLTNNSPAIYKEAWISAQEQKVGIHQYGIGTEPTLHPIQLKRLLTPQRQSGHIMSHTVTLQSHDQPVTCIVRNNANADYLNEANIWVLKSSILNAGFGLFLKPTSPSRRPICIPPKKTICVYCIEPTSGPVSQMPTTDYLLEVERSGTSLFYNPQVYDGHNIGRFLNQGGLLQGIEEMCVCCDGEQGGEGIQQGRVHKVMEDMCNTAYQVSHGQALHVVASKRIESCNSPTELLINYSYTYWTHYIASNHKKLGYNNPIVSGILWCYLSRKSVLYGTVEFNAGSLPQDILSRYLDMECPFRQDQRRRRAH